MNIEIMYTIETLSKERQLLVQAWENTYDPTIGEYGDYLDVWPLKADELSEKIYALIKKHNLNIPFEFAIEQLTYLGGSPCLLYDDRGHFAVSGDGYASACKDNEPCDMNISHYVEKDMWKKTIREAFDYYLNIDNE